MAPLIIAFVFPLLSGHSNVHIATLRRLLLTTIDRHLQIHVLSDEPMRKRVTELPGLSNHTLTFHALGEQDALDFVTSTAVKGRHLPGSLIAGTQGAGLDIYRNGVGFLCPEPKLYIRHYSIILEIFREIKPDFVVVDILFGMGVDACETAGIKFGYMVPISSLDIAGMSQPGARGFWKYPFFFTNIPYPIPLWMIPINIALCIYFIYKMITSPERRALDAARHKLGLKGSAIRTPSEGADFVLVPSLPELEYPHVPLPNAVLCGPIVTPEPPVSAETFPEIANFLDAGRTALINLGSLFEYTRDDVISVTEAIREARGRLQGHGELQVLWKLPSASSFQDLLREKLGLGYEAWVKIEEWIKPNTLAILGHPNLVTFVHHGGANSVHEASYAGIPQIILPQWYDLYTFARRVDTLGYGIYANQGHEAHIDAGQLADALEKVFYDKEGEQGYGLKAKAMEISLVCKQAQGDRRAAETIVAAALGSSAV